MRAGQDDGALEAGAPREEAEKLRLLAAHHILMAGAALADAGEDADVVAAVGAFRPHRAPGEAGERRGRIEIGRLAPALPCSRHAANQHLDGAGDLGAEQLVEHRRIVVAADPAHALVGACREGLPPLAVDTPGAHVRRAPIHRHPVRPAGQCALPASEARP
jgi:hypothetical protein